MSGLIDVAKYLLPAVVILAGYAALCLSAGWRVMVSVMVVHLGDHILDHDREYL